MTGKYPDGGVDGFPFACELHLWRVKIWRRFTDRSEMFIHRLSHVGLSGRTASRVCPAIRVHRSLAICYVGIARPLFLSRPHTVRDGNREGETTIIRTSCSNSTFGVFYDGLVRTCGALMCFTHYSPRVPAGPATSSSILACHTHADRVCQHVRDTSAATSMHALSTPAWHGRCAT